MSVIATSGLCSPDGGEQLVGVAGLGHDVEPGALEQVHDARAQQHGVLRHDDAHRARLRRRGGFLARDRGEHGLGERARRRRPVLAVLRERVLDRGVERDGQLRPRVAQRRRRVLEVRDHLLQVAVAVERRRAGERLEQHAGERVHVGPAVDVAAARLLGRHVVRRAHREAGPRQPVVGLAPLGQAEVGQERVLAAVAPGDQHVRRLDVAVDEAVRVRDVERARDLATMRAARSRLERRPGQQRAEVGALDEAHGHVEDAVLLAGVEHLDRVRVVDRRPRRGTRCSKRARKTGSCAASGAISFSATGRSSARSVARNTTPMPPRPATASMRCPAKMEPTVGSPRIPPPFERAGAGKASRALG